MLEASSTPGGPANLSNFTTGNAGMANLANFDTNSTALTLMAQGVGSGSYYIRVYGKNTCGLSAPSNEVLRVIP
jgi:hypothetical protein